MSCFGEAFAVFLTVFLTVFLATFLAAFPVAFLASFFEPDFLTTFLAAFLAFFPTRPLFLATRDLAAPFCLMARAGEVGFVLFAFFLDDFFFAVATTESFVDRNEIVGSVVRRSVYRVASASIENTEKTSGLRSRL